MNISCEEDMLLDSFTIRDLESRGCYLAAQRLSLGLSVLGSGEYKIMADEISKTMNDIKYFDHTSLIQNEMGELTDIVGDVDHPYVKAFLSMIIMELRQRV